MTQFFRSPMSRVQALQKKLGACYNTIRDELLAQYNAGHITLPEFQHECNIFRTNFKLIVDTYQELNDRRRLGINTEEDEDRAANLAERLAEFGVIQ